MKYSNNKMKRVSSISVLKMLFLCNCLKSKETRDNEATMKTAINQVLKTFDVIQIIKTCQSMKLFKEIVFEPHQKIIFEHLLSPIVVKNEIRSSYDNDFNLYYDVNNEERLRKKRNKIKVALSTIAEIENPDETDTNIQKLLLINENLKKEIFKRDAKNELIQKQFWSKFIIYLVIHKTNNKKVTLNTFEKFFNVMMY